MIISNRERMKPASTTRRGKLYLLTRTPLWSHDATSECRTAIFYYVQRHTFAIQMYGEHTHPHTHHTHTRWCSQALECFPEMLNASRSAHQFFLISVVLLMRSIKTHSDASTCSACEGGSGHTQTHKDTRIQTAAKPCDGFQLVTAKESIDKVIITVTITPWCC